MRNRKHKSLAGLVFNRFTVIKEGDREGKHIAWECVCECGKSATVRGDHLTSGWSKSCGCYQKDIVRLTASRIFKVHGGSVGKVKEPLFKRWLTIRARCLQESHEHYKYYGRRGITICREWDDYINFKLWGIASGFKEELQIDRINNDLGYFPGNCRWVTRKVNCNNRRAWGTANAG
jgi:hypothetical protein